MARKTTRGTRTQITASMADLGSHKGISIFNTTSFSFSFVLNEELQLAISPVVNPVVKPFSSSLLPYSFQVFHYNLRSQKLAEVNENGTVKLTLPYNTVEELKKILRNI